MNLRYTILIITIFTLAQSCLKDPDVIETIPDCPAFVDLGTFELASSSTDFLPYTETMQRVIFSNEQNVEFSAEIIQFGDGISTTTSLTQTPCEEDSTQTFQYTHSAETKNVTLEITELNMRFLLRLRTTVTRKEQLESLNLPDLDPLIFVDALNATMIHPADQFVVNSQMNVVVDPRNHPFSMLTIPEPTTTINGEIFTNVYYEALTNIGQPAEFDLHYTKEEGLIGVVKKDGTLSLKFERVE